MKLVDVKVGMRVWVPYRQEHGKVISIRETLHYGPSTRWVPCT